MARSYDENLILGYVEGDLSPDDREKAEALLAKDPELAALVVGMTQDCVALRSLPREVPPADLVDDVLAQVERSMLLGDPVQPLSPSEEPAARRFRFSRFVAYSGMAALLLISGGLLTYTLTTGGILDTAEQHAAVGDYFASGARAGARRAAVDEPRQRTAAAAPTRQAAMDTAEPAAPAPAPPKPEAMPEMAKSVQELALAPAPQVTPTPRFRRYTAPLVFRPDARPRAWAGNRLGEDAGEPAAAAMRVKVLTSDPGRAKREVLQWATSNAAEVVEEEAVEGSSSGAMQTMRADAAEAAVAETPAGRQQHMVIVRLNRQQALDLVQRLNRDGQEAGIVPLDAVVRRSADGRLRERSRQDANRLIAQQMASSAHAKEQEVAARALTRKLESLQQRALDRQFATASSRAAAMQPAALSAPSAPGATAEIPQEADTPSEETGRLALTDSSQPQARLPEVASDHWGLLFQYELPNPVPARDALSDLALDPEQLTVPVIISESPAAGATP